MIISGIDKDVFIFSDRIVYFDIEEFQECDFIIWAYMINGEKVPIERCATLEKAQQVVVQLMKDIEANSNL